jgi:hypothetical protein
MENPEATGNSCEKRARFAGQNSTSIGSSDSEDTAFAVIACVCPSMSVAMTDTPVAKRPRVSRKDLGLRVLKI